MKNDTDIKKMFDNAVESGINTDIEAGRIKNNVMERLNKQAKSSLKLSDGAETVKPLYVTESTKKLSRSPLIIAAAATAAVCLGITAVSAGLFGRGSGIAALEGENPDDDADKSITTVLETQAETKNDDRSEETKTEEPVTEVGNAETAPQQWTDPFKPAESDGEGFTGSNDKAEENHVGSHPAYLDEKDWGERIPLKNTSFSLLDGTEVEIPLSGGTHASSGSQYAPLLSEVNGRLYYWNGKEKKDVTDLISMNTYYVDSYENEGSGLTHYIVIGGDIASGKYGYAEVFPIYERGWAIFNVSNFGEITPNADMDQLEKDAYETLDIIQDLATEFIRQKTGYEMFLLIGSGGCGPLKNVVFPCDEQ